MKRIIIFSISLIFAFGAISQANALSLTKGPMSAGAGIGLTIPFGDYGDAVKIPLIPLLGSFQYGILPYLSAEGDGYYEIYSKSEIEGLEYFQFQIGLGARFWMSTKFKPGKTFDGIYFGTGIALTNIEFGISDEYYGTLVLKGGYLYKFKKVLMDFGLRYDVVEFKHWADQGITIYALATFLFK